MMNADDAYRSRGFGRGELGDRIGDAYWTYNGGVFTLIVPQTVLVKTVQLNVHCQNILLDCQKVTITGDLQVDGNTNIDGNLTVAGNATVDGKIECGATVTAAGDVVAGSISLMRHTHYGVHGRTSGPT